MRAAETGWLLGALARGGIVELSREQLAWLEALRARELVRHAADPGAERERLVQLRAELAHVSAARAAGGAGADLVGRERGLRTAIVELSERLAESEGAAEVRVRGEGGPYRDAGLDEVSRWQVTHRGRALLGDLGPRLVRAGGAELPAFEAEMAALRQAIRWRAQRAAEIAKRLDTTKLALGHALGSVAVGLAAVRDEPQAIASVFLSTWQALRQTSQDFTPQQDAAATECLLLAAARPAALTPSVSARWLHATRMEMRIRYANGQTEDALDAAVLLATMPAEAQAGRIQVAWALAEEMRRRGAPITISLALLASAGEAELPPHLAPTLAAAFGALGHEIADPAERLTVAVLLTVPRGDLASQLERWRTLRQYLSRFAPQGMGAAAALLSWLALEPAEILDDLRLASAEVQRHRLGHAGADTMTLAIKLLISMGVLASGREGDHEERLALAPVVAPRVPSVGLHNAVAALPLAPAALTAFHRTVLDAAAEWERQYHPTHSSFVYGSGRRGSGWG